MAEDGWGGGSKKGLGLEERGGERVGDERERLREGRGMGSGERQRSAGASRFFWPAISDRVLRAVLSIIISSN